MTTDPKHGFTLIEVLIVVMILGVLAAIVIPAFGNNTDTSAQKAFILSIRQIADIAAYHYERTGEYFEDSFSGQSPDGLDAYLPAGVWTGSTPIGGVWDFERDSFGVRSAFGVRFLDVTPQSDDYMLQIDTDFDDGNLETGYFRKLDTDRFYYIVAQ